MGYRTTNGILSPKGWLLEHLRRDARGIAGNLDRIFPDAGGDIFGKDKVEHQENGYWSSWWPGEVRGNWMEGLVRLAFLLRDKQLLAKAEDIVRSILANQAEDGYIGIYREGSRYVITKRFGELWTQSRAMRTLLVYHRHTGDRAVFEALVRMADNIVANMRPLGSLFEIPDEDGSKGHSLMIIDGLYEMYRLTGKEDYKTLCLTLYEDYCAHPSQFIQDDLRIVNVMDPAVPFVGHGPHTCESLRLPLILHHMTGDARYLEAFRCGLAKLDKNLTLSGSCKSDEFIGTYQSSLVMENDERASVFGGSIPLPSTGFEYCSTTELLFDYTLFQQLLEDPSFADRLEWLVYNAGLASKHPDGKTIQYLGAENMYDASAAVNPRFDYSSTHDDAAGCCAANSARLMPAFAEHAFLQDDDSLLANLYMPVQLRLQNGLTVTETTDYPFDYTVTLRFSGKGSTRLSLRIPKFARGFTLTVNGKEASYTLDGQILTLKQRVKGATAVVLTLQPEISMLRAPDGTFAVTYGTLLFSRDIPAAKQVRRRYAGGKGFMDADFVPKPHENWDFVLLVDAQGNCAGAKLLMPETAGYPLDGYCLKIAVKALDRYAYPVELELLPIGATTLRRTTFPVLHDINQIYRMEG